MRLSGALLWFVCGGVVCAQISGDKDVARAQAGIAKLRQLVDAGAAPRAELERAEAALADAEDQEFLRNTLYGTELTESQLDAMVAAAGRRLHRKEEALERARKLVDVGVASQASLETFTEALEWAQKEYTLAESRAKSVHEIAEMAAAEEKLHQRLEEEPGSAPQVAERFDGDGSFTAAVLQQVEHAFELRFSRTLPVSAMGKPRCTSARIRPSRPRRRCRESRSAGRKMAAGIPGRQQNTLFRVLAGGPGKSDGRAHPHRPDEYTHFEYTRRTDAARQLRFLLLDGSNGSRAVSEPVYLVYFLHDRFVATRVSTPPRSRPASRSSARQISADYPAGTLQLICILKGACFFLADLARAIQRDVRVDFMGISSYGKGKTSSGEVRVTKDLDISLEDATC